MGDFISRKLVERFYKRYGIKSSRMWEAMVFFHTGTVAFL
jgi:hypothetical protein